MVWMLLLLLLLLLQPLVIGLAEHRNPDKALAWVLVATLLPLIGLILFYYMGREFKVPREHACSDDTVQGCRNALRSIDNSRAPDNSGLDLVQAADTEPPRPAAEAPHALPPLPLLKRMPTFPVTAGNRAKVLTDGTQAFRDMLEAMEKAEDHIHVEFYTIRHDGIGTKFQQLWMRKARQGVDVRIIYDGLGSKDLSADYVRRLRESGVDIRCFLPPRTSFWKRRVNHRNHRKLVVVDGKTGYLGGLNIGDEYVGKHPVLGYWRDTHLRLDGNAAMELQAIFLQDWESVSGELLRVAQQHRRSDAGGPGDEPVQIIASGPDTVRPFILLSYFSLINSAKHTVQWTTPYFIPDPSLRMALKTAVLSGVDVRILIPDKPDHRIVQLASLSYVKELLQAGVRFYLCQKGFIHAKTLVVDDMAAAVGTANLDMRSLYKNYELTALLYHPRAIRKLKEDFARDLEESVELRLDRMPVHLKRGMAFSAFTRVLSPLL